MVSVVMPIRNEGLSIERTLGAVLKQDYPADSMEVLLVDGESTDDTRAKIDARASSAIDVRILDNPARATANAMNIGIRESRGEIIVRVDGHTVIAPDYVSKAVEALARTGAHNVGGLMRPVSTNRFSEAVSVATCSRFGVGSFVFHYATAEQETDTVYLGVYPKWVLDHIGGYDEAAKCNEDDEMNFRLRGAGGKIVLCPELMSWYYPRTGLRTLVRQYFRYGFWKVRVMQKHFGQMRASHLAPGLFVLAVLAGAAGWSYSQSARVVCSATIVAWAFCAGVACLAEMRKRERAVNWLLPATFLALHVSYGLGFLAGLVRFAGQWGRSGTPVPDIPPAAGPQPADEGQGGNAVGGT